MMTLPISPKACSKKLSLRAPVPLAALFALGLALFLASCTGVTLKAPFRGYNKAYADAMNEQLLVNLARLDNGHPAYHLAIGAINNKFTFSTEATMGGTSVDTASLSNQVAPAGRTLIGVASNVLTRTLGGKVNGTSSPDFQLIPLNNEVVAAQLLKPITTDVFFTLYQQGYPVDQLLRMLIERIEARLPGGEELTLFNSPVRGTPESYMVFLRTCAILREMQRSGDLVLVTPNEADVMVSGPATPSQNEDVDADAAAAGTKDKGDGSDKGKGKGSGRKKGEEADQEEASAGHSRKGNHSDSPVPSAWEKRATPIFMLRGGKRARLRDALAGVGVADAQEVVSNLLDMLNGGIAVKDHSEDHRNSSHSRIILRSYARILEAVAGEQNGFQELMKDAAFRAKVPPSEQRPILRTVWTGYQGTLQPALQTVTYSGKSYQITDPVLPPLDPAVSWNRDVFRLLAALASQVTVDISKFQRQVIELQ